MADVEDCSPPTDPCSGGCCKPASRITRTILHVVMVTILLSVSLFAYLYLYRKHYPYDDGQYGYAYDGQYVSRSQVVGHRRHIYGVASQVVELVAYAAVGCLYIFTSSGRQEKIISAGYLVLVLAAFLLCSIGITPVESGAYGINEFIFGANMVAISTYCLWKLSFILPFVASNMVAIPLSMKKINMATILHATIVAMLFAVIIVFYVVPKLYCVDMSKACLVQLVAYNAVGCLYICSSSREKEKVISVGCLVLLLFVFLLGSLANSDVRIDLISAANILAISSYCIWNWKLYVVYTLLRRWFDALDGDAVPVPRPPKQQQDEEEAVLELHHQSPFHMQEVLREFSSDEIQAMTQDFGTMIGRGGSAQVFRGNLDDGTPVAVKRINIHSGHTVAGEEDFRRELSIIANVHHRSLVRLLGYCLQRGGGLYLIYPFFENSSLDRWIFHGSEEQRRQLTWPKRLGIAVDVARALAYLHNECHWRILHLDVKPGNILLDGDLRAHVSDFGISLSITRGMNSVVDTEHLKGTFGYMAPEMLYSAVSDKSDVFSYGMTLLELVGGRRNMYPSLETPDLTRDYFPYIVRDMVARGEVLGAVDAATAASVDNEEAVKTVLKVALCCIQNQRELRPSMQTVVDMLEGKLTVDLPPASRHHLL